MKKQIFISTILFGMAMSLASASMAQSKGPVTPVRVGSVILNIGVGVGADYKGYYYNSAFGTKAALEFGLWQAGPGVITLGPEVGASFSNGGRNYAYKSNTIVVAGRSAWHYGWKVQGLDTYGGVSAGVGFNHYEYNNNTNDKLDDTSPVFGGFVGASYFVTPTFGFNAEVGYDITQAQVGLVFKLK